MAFYTGRSGSLVFNSKPVAKIRDCIMSWESEVRKYEDQSGETFPETSKTGAIIDMCPSELKTHVRLNGNDFTSYQQI